jgi:hypothetical protein
MGLLTFESDEFVAVFELSQVGVDDVVVLLHVEVLLQEALVRGAYEEP